AQGETKIDLSEEIAAVQKSEANARAALKEIEEKSKNIDQNLEEKRLLIEHALAQSSNSINPYPLINALKMAQIAAQDGNYQAAQAYLGQASNTFTLFNLNQSNYAQYQEALIKLRTEYSVLAAQAAPTTKIDNIIKSLASWPYKNTNPLNLLSPQKENKPADWKARLKGVGQNILEKTVTVTKIDDAGLTWIKTNETLQTILKENLRLDLAYARNALQLHDYTTYSATADQLRSQIERLFDTENTDVATALTTLENLKDSGEQIPDINGLISKIEQTAKE
ncbi:MAG: uroporphyrinogen-III C-methyltransferase, partial [Cardiobacteriaceae bacterium]|nr:uroporphyrinogen-III C-methyltransferase [Cardiobacteriaceae bacterium]